MELNIYEALQQGVAALKAGEFKKAEYFYKAVLQIMPTHPDANHNLGVIAASMNNSEIALEFFKKAIEFKPNFTEAHSNLGIIYHKVGKLNEAGKSYRGAIELKYDYVDVHYNLGILLQEQGRLSEAGESYKKALEFKSDFVEAQTNLSLVLRQNRLLNILKERKSTKSFKSNLRPTSNPIILKRKVESELLTTLYKLSSIKVDKTKDARYGNGLCSDFQLFDNDVPIIKKVEKDLIKIVGQAIKSDIYIMDSFFNILKAGSGSTAHNHINNFDKFRGLSNQKYSLTYYLTTGDQSSSEPGTLKLYEPNNEILPSKGSIIIIPSSRRHSAVYSGVLDRVMIGVNFYTLI